MSYKVVIGDVVSYFGEWRRTFVQNVQYSLRPLNNGNSQNLPIIKSMDYDVGTQKKKGYSKVSRENFEIM